MTEELSTRDRIIHATAELMELHGYHGTGLNDIVKHSGAPKGSIYHYFPDGKEEIALETVEMANNMINQHTQATLVAYDDPSEAVRAVIYQVIDHCQLHACRRFGMPSPMEMASVSEKIRQLMDRKLEERRLLFQQKLIGGGIALEQATQISWLIVSAIFGGGMMARVNQDTSALQNIAEQLYTLIKSALP